MKMLLCRATAFPSMDLSPHLANIHTGISDQQSGFPGCSYNGGGGGRQRRLEGLRGKRRWKRDCACFKLTRLKDKTKLKLILLWE